VDLHDEGELEELAASGVSVYAQLYTEQGGIVLLMPADAHQQEDLARRGYSIQVFESGSSGANYYLLYGLPDVLRWAGVYVDLLVIQGRQAVARATPEQMRKMAELDLKSLPLRLYTLVSYVSQKRVALPTSVTPNPFILEMIAQVDTNTLYASVGDLSGEWPVIVNGSPYTIATRYTYTDKPIKKATRFAYEYFQSLGLPSWYDYYTIDGVYERRSVLAQQTGLTQPGRIYLLTAHLDSTSHMDGNPYLLAPGADDNASGSAALMHIAEILKPYNFGCTLRYALFTGEEVGYYGSQAYAAEVYSQGENVEAVLNLDMLAYNTPGTGATMELHTRPGNASDLAIANLFADVVPAYQINLVPLVLQDGLSFSDHASFWQRGYPAILAMEDWSDHTPYYHKTSDRLGTLDMGYYTEFIKASLATFAHMGCLLESQLRGTVRDADSGDPLTGATVEVRLDGQVVESTNTQADGSYQFALPPGVYSLVFSASGHLSESVDDIQIVQGEIEVLDANLQVCIAVESVDFSFSPAWPEVSETVVFTGMVGAGDPPITYSWDFGDGGGDSDQITTHAYSSKGGYLVSLTANNACGLPSIAVRMVPVEPYMNYLPFVVSQAGP
jgi:hypothetical protein